MIGITSLIALVVSATILYYVFYLEKEQCMCVMDWRHNYVKYFTILAVILSLLQMTFNARLKDFLPMLIVIIISIAYLLAGFVNVYSVYTYVGELDSTKCGCAIHDMKNIHNFLYYWRYLMVVGAVILTIIVALFITGGMGSLLLGSSKGHNESAGKHKK